MDRNDIWYKTEELVKEVGVAEKYKGFYYLVFAVVISVESGMRKDYLYKEVYDLIASVNDVSCESVEKCIRYCIRRVCMQDPDVFSVLAGHEVKKPTNEEVIAIISSCIRLESSTGF